MGEFADQICGRYNLIHSRIVSYNCLHHLMAGLSRFSASDARDTVFASLGLYLKYSRTKQTPQPLIPNYYASTATVFRDATKLMITEIYSLDPLIEVQHRSEMDMKDWITWVPRWARGFDREVDAAQIMANGDQPHKGYEARLDQLITEDADTLAMVGFVADYVASATPVYTADIYYKPSGVQAMLECANALILHPSYGPFHQKTQTNQMNPF